MNLYELQQAGITIKDIYTPRKIAQWKIIVAAAAAVAAGLAWAVVEIAVKFL